MGKYLYNKDTGKLHIKGYWQYTKYGLEHCEEFDTEVKVLAFNGWAVGLCKKGNSKIWNNRFKWICSFGRSKNINSKIQKENALCLML